MAEKQKRIWLWSVLRSLSTAFTRCMMARESCRGFFEPWVLSYYFSAERKNDRFKHLPDREGTTFKDRKELLESPLKGYKEVFVKDHAYRLKTFLESDTHDQVVPKGYIHTFLIRHPAQTVPSLYRGYSDELSGFKGFEEQEASFVEIVKMHDYVTKTLGQKSIIIDAEDLMKDPETTLRLYCEAVGIDFQDSMLKWPPLTPEQYKEFEEWVPWVTIAMESTGILPQTPSKHILLSDLPQEVQNCIEKNIPLYNRMYEMRLRPNAQNN